MSAEWVTAIATVATFVVIGASAIAALMQLRHMRGSNQIAALMECRAAYDSKDFRDALRFVSTELPLRLRDPAELPKITGMPLSGEYQALATVANFFEYMGLFVRTKIIDESIACDFWAPLVRRYWNALLPVTTCVRVAHNNPGLWENFEYFAMLSERYRERYSYPAGTPRMPQDRSLLDQLHPGHTLDERRASRTVSGHPH